MAGEVAGAITFNIKKRILLGRMALVRQSSSKASLMPSSECVVANEREIDRRQSCRAVRAGREAFLLNDLTRLAASEIARLATQETLPYLPTS